MTAVAADRGVASSAIGRKGIILADRDRALRWDDPELAIEWPATEPLLSDKDRTAPMLAELDETALPRYREREDGG